MIDDPQNEMEIIENLLNASSNEETFHIPDNEFRNFVSYISKQQVEMEPEATEMLKDYFKATRIIRPSERF